MTKRHAEVGNRVHVYVHGKTHAGTVERTTGVSVIVHFDAPHPATGERGEFSRASVHHIEPTRRDTP